MLVAVIGGTGTLGREVAAELVRRGHDVRQLSRRAPERPVTGAGHRSIDVTTGAGLRDALAGAGALVDAASTMSLRRAHAVLAEGTRRVSAEAAAAGVRHHVLCSIVGIDDVPMAYYRAKLEQERVVREADTPWSIVRATQFHAMLDRIFSLTARVGLLPAARFVLQPIDARVVASTLADAAEGSASRAVFEVAGPEVLPLRELARRWRAATRRRALLAPVPIAGAAGRGLRQGALTAPGAAVADSPGFDAWLRARLER